MDSLASKAKSISERSKEVRIDPSGIELFCRSFDPSKMKHWLSQSPFSIKNLQREEKIAYLSVFNSISFCYWGEPKWTIQYKGKSYDGSWAMHASIGKAIESGKPILNPEYLSEIPKKDLQDILSGNTDIPLFDERLNNIREIGSVIIKKYAGRFINLIEESRNDAKILFKILIEQFPSFKDIGYYDNEPIGFYKRAQLLVSDISQDEKLRNIRTLTACADYKLPQVLRRYGILRYSPNLAEVIDNKIEIPHGDSREIEIRANTLHAIELIKEKIGASSSEINDYVWLEGQIKLPTDKPYHRTRTTAY